MFDEFKDKLIEHKTKIDQYKEYMNSVSNDVKLFEVLLEESYIDEDFCYFLDEQDDTEYLVYDCTKKRLIYIDEGQNAMNRPLRETPIETRIRCHPHLKLFMKKIVESL